MTYLGQSRNLVPALLFLLILKVMQLVSGPKYDPSYKKETNAVIAGIILLALPALWYVLMPVEKQLQVYRSFSPAAIIVITCVDLILRTIVTGWVKTIAIRQNRDKTIWGLFAFFFPSVVLICIGLTGKIDRSGEQDSLDIKSEKNKLRAIMIALFIVVMITMITLMVCFWEIIWRK